MLPVTITPTEHEATMNASQALVIPDDGLEPEREAALALQVLRTLDGLSLTTVGNVLRSAERLAIGLTKLDCRATGFVRAAEEFERAPGQ